MNFNPRSPHGERHASISYRHPRFFISIHAPRMGSDRTSMAAERPWRYFNPRSPHGERHTTFGASSGGSYISIHAPRMGSDNLHGLKVFRSNISIHAPRMGSDS